MHPTDEDLSAGTPVTTPTDEDLFAESRNSPARQSSIRRGPLEESFEQGTLSTVDPGSRCQARQLVASRWNSARRQRVFSSVRSHRTAAGFHSCAAYAADLCGPCSGPGASTAPRGPGTRHLFGRGRSRTAHVCPHAGDARPGPSTWTYRRLPACLSGGGRIDFVALAAHRT